MHTADKKAEEIQNRQGLSAQKRQFIEVISSLAKDDMKAVDEMLEEGIVNSSASLGNVLAGKQPDVSDIWFFEGNQTGELVGCFRTDDGDIREPFKGTIKFGSQNKVSYYEVKQRI